MMKFCQEQACEQKGSTDAPAICLTVFQQKKKHLFVMINMNSTCLLTASTLCTADGRN